MAQFTDEQLNEIWVKGLIDSRFDPNLIRKDACGAWMVRGRYNDRNSPFGWEVDHIYPESKLKDLEVPNELIDNMVNLRPLNWKNNVSKGSDYPHYQSKSKASTYKDSKGKDFDVNIDCEDEKEINDQTQQQIEALFKGYRL